MHSNPKASLHPHASTENRSRCATAKNISQRGHSHAPLGQFVCFVLPRRHQKEVHDAFLAMRAGASEAHQWEDQCPSAPPASARPRRRPERSRPAGPA
eukprot:7297706-Lingulodinium_polyedra.AAC.1